MFATSTTRLLSCSRVVRCFTGVGFHQSNLQRFKSTSVLSDDIEDDYDDDSTNSCAFDKSKGGAREIVSFPSQPEGDNSTSASMPVLLNSNEHAVGYLGRVLNARVYEAAIETELQEAKNLSSVCILHCCRIRFRLSSSLNNHIALAK